MNSLGLFSLRAVPCRLGRPVPNPTRNTNSTNLLKVPRASAGTGNGVNFPSNVRASSGTCGHRRRSPRRPRACISKKSPRITTSIDLCIWHRCTLTMRMESCHARCSTLDISISTNSDRPMTTIKNRARAIRFLSHPSVSTKHRTYRWIFTDRQLILALSSSCLMGDAQLSLCGHTHKQSGIPDEVFNAHLVSFETFASNPSIVNDPNLVVRIGGKYVGISRAHEDRQPNVLL